MVLAAGLGTRMRPLTDAQPKALVEVGGKALIDHMLDRLGDAGVERAVVNVHAFADVLVAHLGRRTTGPKIAVSDERAHPMPLETGGGVKFARLLLAEAPILVANIDSVWIEDAEPPSTAIQDLCRGFDPARMDARLLLARMERTSGFDGAGDFAMDGDGRLLPRRVTGAATAPLNYMGVHIVDPRPIYADPRTEFGLFPLWADWAAAGRLHGTPMEGDWMHVGDPGARDAAEARLTQRAVS
ncbi:MAG TPA: nucleotidyltransferase family protein [Caulobacteraceae bacterium]|jgi:MurNAc alpha-1-phosphate uridylyltransferase|nr:nucleotidyltransferase family protein [Caulobacteraceae bacterium]